MYAAQSTVAIVSLRCQTYIADLAIVQGMSFSLALRRPYLKRQVVYTTKLQQYYEGKYGRSCHNNGITIDLEMDLYEIRAVENE